MIAPALGGTGTVTPRSYFSMLRRLNLLRQVIGFRREREWGDAMMPLERTRQFFIARGTIPYYFHPPIDLSRSPTNPFSGVSVFFGPPHSDQVVVFARRQNDSHYTLIHLDGTKKAEKTSFPLDKRFGTMRQACITSLFGWRMRWGTFDEYVNPVEFHHNPDLQATEIRMRVNALVENGPSHEMPAQLVGAPEGGMYRWTITRLGQAHDWFPDTNTRLFLPGYDPHEVVYGLGNDKFICKGTKKSSQASARWAVWNNCWDQIGHRPLVADLEAKHIGPMAVNTIQNGRTIYSCVLGSLPESHPLASECPGIMLTSEGGELGMVRLDDLVDVRRVLAVHIAGSISGIFHCTRRGPSAQLVIHQSGIPLGGTLDNLEFHGFHVEGDGGAQRLIRVKLVASENNGQRLVLYTATTTAWTETLGMMNTPLPDLQRAQIAQENTLQRFVAERQGSSVTVLQLKEGKDHLSRSALIKWWDYLAKQARQQLNVELGPYITRSLALQLIESYRSQGDGHNLKPLLIPLAKVFDIEVRAVDGLENDEEFVRFTDELKQFLLENRLIIGSNDLAIPADQVKHGQVMVILHPGVLEWKETAESEEEPEGKGIFAR